MKCRRVIAVGASVVGLLAFVAFGATASAKAGAKSFIKAGNNAGMIESLESAHHLLASADHDYDGRRAKAMEEIKKAIRELSGKEKTGAAVAMVKAPKIKVAKAKVKEPQAESDAKLREAISILSGLGSQAGSHHKASGHVSAAMGHLNAALHIR